MTESTFGTLIETTVRVVSWNIWWRFGPWEARQPAIIETLRRLDPDIVCLQEVWIDLATGESSAHRIAAALGWDAAHIALGNRADLDGLGFGNAVISRWPVTSSETAPLFSPADLEEHRVVVRADIDGPRGPLQVFTTHLHWRYDHSSIRQEQVGDVCRFVASSPDRSFPAVLTGDFNADPASDEIRLLTGRAAVPAPPLVFFDAWEVAGEGDGATWSNDNPFAVRDLEITRRIDFVFAGYPKQGGAGHVVAVDLVGVQPVAVGDPPAPAIVPSDHYGVVADLRY